jgi:hypothetical protein
MIKYVITGVFLTVLLYGLDRLNGYTGFQMKGLKDDLALQMQGLLVILITKDIRLKSGLWRIF